MFVKRNEVEPIDFNGLQILDYTSNGECTSSIAFIDVPPGGSHAEAWSKRSDKYYLVIRGSVLFTLDDKSVELGAGDFCLVRRGRRFAYSNQQTDRAALVLVHTPAFRLEDDVFAGSGI